MITNNEINAVKLSATKKDYYQIWNELIEVAGKISDRWDPATTNESDPGIVLLKVLTAIADKINYNIDVNTLEAFMPSAAQTESMRNLCEMMGYNIKYYQSASTEINIKYVGDEKTQFKEINEITLPMFTTVSNQEKDVNYVTLEAKNFSADNKSQTVLVMEGQHVQCETINNNVITIDMLDDNNRFYLPENQIAENGIFIYRISDGVKSGRWEKVESLYTEHFNNLIYKFGYDSKEARPYVQFPDDIGQIIEDGLEIHYIRTSGIAGNIAAYTLSTFELPSGTEWQGFSAENDFTINQLSAANNGANIESISDAYKSFKRTVGTFETLVTCRDYMNKIYNLMEDTNVPMVSNIIVSDIRDDINRSVTLCGFSDFGVCYTEKSVVENGEDLIDHFDLLLYPFTTVYGYDNRLEYESSFIYNADNGYSIKRELEDCKTIAHKIKFPNEDEIALIKNYLKLDAKIVTTEKISIQEEIVILNAIKTAIYKNFNLRKLDFSEEIPFDNILDVIENADPRIKNVVLYEPTLLTKFALVDGREFEVGSVIAKSVDGDFIVPRFIGKELYNKLTLRNVLAGRLELFNYNTKFKYFLNEGKAKKPVIDENGNVVTNSGKVVYDTDANGANVYYASVYPNENTTLKQITSIEPRFKLGSVQSDATQSDKKVVIPENYELTRNQEIKFRSPNLITKATYPAYVNYFLKLTTTEAVAAVPAQFISLYDYLNEENNWQDLLDNEIYGEGKGYNLLKLFKAIAKTDGKYKDHTAYINDYGAIFEYNLTTKKYEILGSDKALDENIAYYSIEPSDVSFLVFKNFLKSRKLDLYRALDLSTSRIPGYLVDNNKYKYQEVTKNFGYTTKNYYVPIELGTDAKYASLPKDGEYQLRSGEYLLINYTPSTSSQTEDGTLTNSEGEPISIYYGEGCIIKPNFELVDSESLVTAKLKAYSKKGVDFKTCEKNGKVIEGLNLDKVNMLGLNANEKIEYRDIAHIILDKRYNLYWALTDIEVAKEELIKNDYKYILKDNEYFFIASAEKDSMTYYGSGTELKLSKEDSKFFEGVDSSISLDEILLNGVAGIPWVSRLFDESNTLTITEYKYVTLTEGDKLVEITGLNEELSNKWQAVKDVKYISGDETKYLPTINIKDLYWEAQCLLIMQTNSNSSIKLVSGETLTLKGLDANGNPCKAEDEITIHGTDDYPAIIRSSYIVNGAYEKINTKIDEYTDNTGAKIINDFKISVSNEYPLGMVDTTSSYTDPSIVKLHNFDKNLTSVYFNKFTNEKNYIEFNLNIPSDCYGLIMIYYARSGKLNSEDGSYLVANTPIIANTSKLSIFNYIGAEETGWWDGGKVVGTKDTKYYLKPGINVIKVDSLINNIKIYPNKKLDHSIIFSDLDVVYTDNDINLELLDYQMIPNTSWASIDRDNLVKIKNSGKNIKDSVIEYNNTNKTALYYPEGLEYKLLKVADNITYYEEVKGNLENSETNPRAIARDQLLMALRALDPNNEFYYNCLPDNSIAIDINTNLLGTEDAETMSSPMIWYDSNNINNKFVVSEIDALYLEDGIKIVRSSRR